MRRLIIIICSITLCLGNVNNAVAQDNVFGKYIVDFVPVNTPLGSSPLIKDLMNQWMTQVSTAFADFSNNQITMIAGEFLPPLNSASMKSSSDFATEVKSLQRTKPEGFKKLITVGVIIEDKSLSFAGQAYGDSHILVNGLYEVNLENVDILLHELAHNLGLGHANSITCSIVIKNTNCTSSEYGDYSDIMGRYNLNANKSQAVLRLSAPYISEWGLLNSNQIQVVDNSIETLVAPLYPLSGNGNKIIYLPVYNRNAYSIELRPATGSDQELSSAKVYILNKPGYYYNNTMSYGLQFRYLSDKNSKIGELVPKVSGNSYGDNFIFVNSSTARQGFDPGSVFTFPDGSTVEYLSGDYVTGARIKITRPADTEKPEIKFSEFQINGEVIADKSEVFAKAKSPGVVAWPTVSFSYQDLTDNRRISEMEILIDGIPSKISNELSATSGKAEAEINTYGNHSVKLVVKDFSGNINESQIFTLKVSKFVFPAIQTTVTPGQDPLTQLDVYVEYSEDSDANLQYDLTELNYGQIINVEKGMNGITFRIGALPRNSTFKATLKRIDPAGNPATDSEVSGAVDQSVCTQTLCYVGIKWDADPFFWSIPAQALQLQEKINGKWKVVASAKPYLSPDGLKGAPYAYDLFYTNKKVGQHAYRLYQPAFKYKGKSYSPYIGKTFYQKVIA